jgi:hypothetical protein
MSIIAYPLEATEYTAEDAQSYLSTRTSGVYSEEITLTPEGMTAKISPFMAWFNYAKFKGCSVAVTEVETLNFSPPDVVGDRIDRVVLRLDLTNNKSYLRIIEGIVSSNAVPPEIVRTEAVYDVSPFYVRIKAGATEITSADITSTILDEDVCGIMRDGVTGIPTSQLQKQAEKLIEELDDEIKAVKDGSAFMMGSVYDPESKGKPVAFADEIKEIMYPVGSIIKTRGVPSAIGLPGVWNLVNSFASIPLKRHISVPEANKVYKEIFDVSEYRILRSSYNIVALPKSATPEDVSISFGDITTTTLGEFEYVKTIEINIHRKIAHSTWVHILFSGETASGVDWQYAKDSSGGAVVTWERVE